jgi:predicted nucleotidyltransferase
VSNPFEVALVELAETFEHERLDYMVIGGLAVIVWGTQRLTKDVDIALAIDPWNVPQLLAVIGPQIAAILPDAAELAIETGIVRFRHRAVDIDVAGRPVKFCTAEDLILHKLLADRDQDRYDIRTVIQRQEEDLDREYLDTLVRQISDATARPEILRRYLSLF